MRELEGIPFSERATEKKQPVKEVLFQHCNLELLNHCDVQS